MKKLVLLLIPPLIASAMGVTAQGGNVQSFCNMLPPQNAHIFDWKDWNSANMTDLNVASESFQWDASHDLWRGYNAPEAVDQPFDAFKHWSVTLDDGNGVEQWIYILDSRTTPLTDYIYVFDNTQPSTDSQGKHYGVHPCRVFAADGMLIGRWIQQAYNSRPS